MSNPIVRQIVSRCHVFESNRAVIRYLVSRLRNGYAGFREIPRNRRHALMRDAIKVHGSNRALYERVMRGRF